VREAFNAYHGFEAFSCDLKPCEDGRTDYHIQEDALDVIALRGPWDLVIACPPCTDLSSSGARWFPEKRTDGRQASAVEFFRSFTRLGCPWCIENPIGIMSTLYRKPDQIIQPWQYGHGETKATCLWLHRLPLLKPSNIVAGRENRVWRMPPSAHRAADRSRTYPGIAAAMAEQWTAYLSS